MSELHKRVCEIFLRDGEWPLICDLEVEFRRNGPLWEQLRDGATLLRSDDLSADRGQVILTLEGLSRCPGAAAIVTSVVQTAHYLADRYIEARSSIEVTSEEIAAELSLTPLEVRQVGQLYWRHGWGIRISVSFDQKAGSFSIRTDRRILPFEGVTDLDGFLAAARTLATQRNLEMAWHSQGLMNGYDVSTNRVIPDTELVFLVHGHDETNLLRLQQLLQGEWGIGTVLLSSEASRGRTLIEKFEEEARRVAFAFVFYTPDDRVSEGSGSGTHYGQARPNATFELGWFYGRLGRDRVCILHKTGTAIGSDLRGVGRIEFSEDIREKSHEILRELRSAGITPRDAEQ